MDAVEQARIYNNAEADALSILTDTDYFGGSLNDLWDVIDFLHQHERTTPCLRKDFMIHPIQVLEAAKQVQSVFLLLFVLYLMMKLKLFKKLLIMQILIFYMKFTMKAN